jgi:hypothetical protein
MIREQRGNGLVWRDDDPRGHVESYFLKFNDPAAGRALWIKFTVYSPLGKPAEAVGETWAIHFDARDPSRTFGMKKTFPLTGCRIRRGPLRLEFGENLLEPPRTRGSLFDDQGRTIAWDLVWTEGAEPLALFPYPVMYTARLPKSKVLTPHPDSRFTGTVVVEGRRWTIDRLRGMQGHNWGEEHAHFYAWAQGTVFDDESEGYFEGFSGKVKIGPLITPFLSMAFLKLDGKLQRFDGAGSWLAGKISLVTDRWTFDIPGKTHRLRGEIGAPKERFAGLRYYDPTGKLSYCLNSKVADARIELVDRASGKVVRELRSTAGFALEVLTKDEGHGVRMFA